MADRTDPLTVDEVKRGCKSQVQFQCYHGDALKMLEEKTVKQRAYRMTFIDLPYNEWTDADFEKVLTDH